jgi:hypothetical protein
MGRTTVVVGMRIGAMFIVALTLQGCDSFLLRDLLDKTESAESRIGDSDDGDPRLYDTVPPVPGGSIAITVTDFDAGSATWPEASDDDAATDELEYKVYLARDDQIDDLAEAEVNAELTSDWITELDSFDFGVVDGYTWHLNVIVRDRAGNTAPYGRVSFGTPARPDIFIDGATGDPVIFENLSSLGGPIEINATPYALSGFSNDALDTEVADIDLDGMPDIIQGRTVGQPTSIYLNVWDDDPATRFLRLQDLTGTGDDFTDVTKLVAANVLGSDNPDLILFRSGNEQYVVENVDGVFLAEPVAPQPDPDFDNIDDVTDVAIADFDGDGLTDFVVGRGAFFPAPNAAFVALGFDGTFRSGDPAVGGDQVLFGLARTRSIVAGPITVGDDAPDVFAANTLGGDDVLYIGDGTGESFTPHGDAILDDGADSEIVALGDLDGDGDLDLVRGRTDVGSSVEVFLNGNILDDGSGEWVTSAAQPTPAIDRVKDLALVDLDGDGDLDIVAIPFVGNEVMVWSNEGATIDVSVTFTGVAGAPFDVNPLEPERIGIGAFIP